MKNIHLFETKKVYETAKSSLIIPTISYIEDTNDVDYRPYHDYVKIGSVKWATMNVGAKSITDYGLYFQWGDTQGYTKEQVGEKEDGKKPFADTWDDYKWYVKENSTIDTPRFKTYNASDKTVLDLKDDAVHTNWGGSWRMPTVDDFQKLRDAVTTEFVTDYNNSGVNGLLCTANDGSKKTLFFPTCEGAFDGTVEIIGYSGFYWANSLVSDNEGNAYGIYFSSEKILEWQGDEGRFIGFPVRGVLDEK